MIIRNKILIIFLTIVLSVLVGFYHYKEEKENNKVPKSAYFVKETTMGWIYNG